MLRCIDVSIIAHDSDTFNKNHDEFIVQNIQKKKCRHCGSEGAHASCACITSNRPLSRTEDIKSFLDICSIDDRQICLICRLNKPTGLAHISLVLLLSVV